MPLRIVSMFREKRGLTLGVAAPYGPNVYGPGFFAPHPIRFVFAPPRKAASGSNYDVAGIPGACPC